MCKLFGEIGWSLGSWVGVLWGGKVKLYKLLGVGALRVMTMSAV